MSDDKPDPGKTPEQREDGPAVKAGAGSAAAKKVASQPIVRPSGPDRVPRRTLVAWLPIGWWAFSGSMAAAGAMFGRFLFPNVLFEPKQSFLAGFPDEYVVGAVSERWKASQAVWIVRDTETLYVLSTVCTHLGCTPNWLENEGKFKCPCHGSGYKPDGINFAGPTPRPLERFRLYVEEGIVVVDKSKKYQFELGQWDQPGSYLEV